MIDGTSQQKQWLLKWYSILKIILVKSCTQSSMVPMTTLVARHVLAGNVLAIEPCTSVYRIHAHVYPYRQLLVWATRYLQCSSFVVESKKRVKVVKVDYTGTLAYLGTRCTACIVYVMYHSRYVYAARIPVHVQSFTLCYNGAQNVLYNVVVGHQLKHSTCADQVQE